MNVTESQIGLCHFKNECQNFNSDRLNAEMCLNDRAFLKNLFFRRRIKCIFRFIYILFFAFFFASLYLLGIIQLNSNKISFSIFPEQFVSSRQSSLSGKVVENYFVPNDNANSYYKEAIGVTEISQTINQDLLVKRKSENANITRLFLEVTRSRGKIVAPLKNEEITKVIRLKKEFNEYLSILQAAAKIKAKKEVKTVPKNLTLEIAAEEDYSDLEVITKLGENYVIKRHQLVEILRYEKIRRQAKVTVNTVQTVLKDFLVKKQKYKLTQKKPPVVWTQYDLSINEFGLTNDTNLINNVLKSMATRKVSACTEKSSGTQIKVIMDLVGDTKVLVKPMKVARNYETPPDHFYFVDFERHHAEIAAFHVDMLLKFYRCPPTVGRLFDMTNEIWKNSDQSLSKTFFYSPAGNTCFTGHCSYYCDTTHATCGRPGDKMEASVQLMLPSRPVVLWDSIEHPYRRSYSKKKLVEWEHNDNYCYEQVFQDTDLHSRTMLDIMDMAVFDFIIGNMDRHHYEKMTSLGNSTFLLHLDHGRSFGKQFHDEMSILTPLTQCCLMRYSTFKRLKYLFKNNFAKLLDDSLRSDPLYPILTVGHLVAVERRLEIVLNELSLCVDKHTVNNVIIDDGY